MKQSQSPDKIKNEKVLALYQAVIDLIEEDADINGMKVADITNRAGIGKGTAYEYFSSKEEMIAEALMYDMGRQLNQIRRLLEGKESLKAQIYGVFEWLEHSFGKRSTTQFFRITSNSYEIHNSLYQEFSKAQGNCQLLEGILGVLIEQGRKEGTVPGEMPQTHVYMTLVSNFISFFIFLGHEEGIEDVNREETKDFLYRNIIRSLS